MINIASAGLICANKPAIMLKIPAYKPFLVRLIIITSISALTKPMRDKNNPATLPANIIINPNIAKLSHMERKILLTSPLPFIFFC
ncbi:MAG: hypothetical protein FE048_01905 [Thermoplasmata archaeon]|nr:MAG: hypothetical protein FE048_01905 [Thermoplasmata archaeon]